MSEGTVSNEPSNGRSRKNPLKTNFILAALLIALGGFAYWYEFKKQPQLKEEEAASSKLLRINEDQEVTRLAIYDKAKDIELKFECNENCGLSNPNAEWMITEPIDFRADSGNVGSFITSVAGVFVNETIQLQGDDLKTKLKEYGLDTSKKESSRIEISVKGNKSPYLIYLGDKAAVGQNIYALVTGSDKNTSEDKKTVHIISPSFRTNMERELSFWRDKRLFRIGSSDIRSFKINNKSGTIEVNQKDGLWYLGNRELADLDTVQNFLTGLVFLNASKYVSDNKKKDSGRFKLRGRPKYTLEMNTKGKGTFKLTIYEVFEKNQPKLYGTLRNKDFIVEFDRAAVDRFNKTELDFKNKVLLSVAEIPNVRTLEVSFGGKKQNHFEFKSENGTHWALTKGKIENFKPSQVGEAMDLLSNARIHQYLNKKKGEGLPKNAKEVSAWTLRDVEGKKITKISLLTDPKGDSSKTDIFVKLSSGEFAKLERGPGQAIPKESGFFSK